MSDLIERQTAIDAIEEVDWYHQNKNKDMVSGANSFEHQAWYKADDIYKTLEALPPAQPEQPPYVAEIEEEYQKAVALPYVRKPLAKALYEVWKKHDREDAERRADE